MKSNSKLQVVGDKPLWDEELRLWLQHHLDDIGMSTTVLAYPENAGGSRTLWDDYLKCTYFGFPKKPKCTEDSKLEKMLRAYRARIEGPKGEYSSNTFLKTTAWHQVNYVCQTTIEENGISLITGAPGKGKTRCMIEFSLRKTTGAIVVTCSPNITTRYFVQKIAKALKLPDHHTTARLEDDIVGYLKNRPRTIVVDQANYLNPKALGSISYIWDQSRVPTILFGTKTLREIFYSGAMTQDERAQLASRVAMQYDIDGLDLSTVKGLCERILGKEAATSAVVKAVFEKVGGKADQPTANFRALEFRLRRLAKLMKLNPELPVAELMDKADRMLMAA